jgi:undecaprenyl-diphosphatase
LIYIVWKLKVNPPLKWCLTVFFFLFACAIAFSRVYLHVHYASDVIAGLCLCLVWLGLSFWLLNRIEKREARKKAV